MALSCQPFGPTKSTSLRPASSTASAWRAWLSISFQAESEMGARSRRRSFMRSSAALALEAADAERAVARARGSAPAGLDRGLAADDGSLREEIGAQRLVELRIVAPDPLEGHRGVLLLFVAIVREDLFQRLVAGGVDPLIVPVDGLQLLAQRRESTVTVDRLRLEQLRILVQSCALRHRLMPSRFRAFWWKRRRESTLWARAQLFPDRVELLPRIDDVGVEVAAMIREDAVGAAVEHDERLRTRGGAERVGDLLEQLLEGRTTREVVVVLAQQRPRQMMDHVRHALRVVEVVVGAPRWHAASVGLAILEQVGVRVAEHVAPALHEADQLDHPAGDGLRLRWRRAQPVDVAPQRRDTVAELALCGRPHEAILVVAEGGVGDDQVGVVLGGRHLGQVILEHAQALAEREDDAPLAVGVVVRHDVRAPEDEVVRPPARAVAQLVIHDRR